jgi:hypothetical protein
MDGQGLPISARGARAGRTQQKTALEHSFAEHAEFVPHVEAGVNVLLALHCAQQRLGLARPQARHKLQRRSLPCVVRHPVYIHAHLHAQY